MKKLLWIDDNEALIDRATSLFEENNFYIFKATNTSRALSILREERLDGILLDVHLRGGESGLELLEVIHRLYPSKRIVIFTGYPDYGDHIVSEEQGATAYLAKISKSVPLDEKKQANFFSALHKLFPESEGNNESKEGNMSRTTVAGMTDYSHQSLDTILNDLGNWSTTLVKTIAHLENNKQKLIDNEYWKTTDDDFKWIFARAHMFYTTALTEINEIRDQMPLEVQPNHVTRLERIGKTSYEINMEWGDTWHNRMKPKQYGDPNFIILEDLYAKSRDMAVDLMDLSNVADRLKDYIGRKGKLGQNNLGASNINVNIGRDFSGNLIVGSDNEANN